MRTSNPRWKCKMFGRFWTGFRRYSAAGLDTTVVRLLHGLMLSSMTPSASILSTSSSTTFCFAGDMGYGRSLKTLAPSISSIVCFSKLVVPRPSFSNVRNTSWISASCRASAPDKVQDSGSGFSSSSSSCSSTRPIIERSSPDAVRTTDRYFWIGTSNASTISLQPLPSRLTLAPVSNNPVSCWVRIRTSANGRGSPVPLRFTAATTSRLLARLFRNRSLAFWTFRDTNLIPPN
ncbi:uncharacterized protein LOC123037252 [Drosophila rhopaloa]|uniref:Secreted protein n=1 Tax=Drosophila rhopaloa TaxID=1041015 RepID=A0ABM5J2L4_DRORH|nr:uncharacterized protein LOC123037252 [Drosophila rhopaloa]